MTRERLEKRILEWDTRKWEEAMRQKSSLRFYRQNKSRIGEVDELYDNRPSSITLFQARTNSLPLNDRVHFITRSRECPLCGEETENLEHFLLHCPGYTEERRKIDKLQQPYQENKEELIGKILYEFENKEEIENTKEIIHKFWKIRDKKIRTE